MTTTALSRVVETLKVRFPEKQPTTSLSMRFPDDVHTALAQVSQREGVPLNSLVVELLRDALRETVAR